MKKIVASLIGAVSLSGLVTAAELDEALVSVDKAGDVLRDNVLTEVGADYFGKVLEAVDEALQNRSDDARLKEFKEHFQDAVDLSNEFAAADEEKRPEMESKLDEYKNEVTELRDYIEELKNTDSAPADASPADMDPTEAVPADVASEEG